MALTRIGMESQLNAINWRARAMIINVLLILAYAIGTSSPATTDGWGPLRIEDQCYINGIWYNPCPPPAPIETPTLDQ